jgi:hypothetical protein
MTLRGLNVPRKTHRIITKAAIFITLSKTKEEMMTTILQNFANLLRLRSAPRKISVEELIIELKDYIIKISTKLSFVIFIQIRFNNVNTVITAPSLTL